MYALSPFRIASKAYLHCIFSIDILPMDWCNGSGAVHFTGVRDGTHQIPWDSIREQVGAAVRIGALVHIEPNATHNATERVTRVQSNQHRFKRFQFLTKQVPIGTTTGAGD